MNSLIYALSINSHSTQVKQAPLKILYDLLKDTDCILIGRCGNYVFRDRGDCISIFLHGEFSKRVESMSKKWKITKTEATKRIPKMDEYRALYHKFYTSEVWGMSNYYDLTINTYRLGYEKTLELLLPYLLSEKYCIPYFLFRYLPVFTVSYFYLFVYGVTYYTSYKFVRLFIFSLKSCLFYSFRQQSA